MVTDRNGLTVLSVDECMRLLSSHIPRIGRVSFVADSRPVILPVNYVFHEGSVVFRTDPGAKLAAASRGQHVAFEIDDIDPTWREGWSVLVQGRAEEVADPDEIERLEQLPLRPWGPGAKTAFVRIMSTEISGRSID
jgi:nitroimidazol reductase NimA-like FMN-containing flavoprotein (pyridoxamine 5'-phosphate oxidase superfamily)